MTSLRNKLWLSFLSLLLILLIVSVLTIVVFTRYSHALERVFRENYNSALYCNTMKESLDQLNDRAERIIWQESIARQIDFSQAESNFTAALNSQFGNSSLPGETELTQHLADLWKQYCDDYARFNVATRNQATIYVVDLQSRYQELRRVAQSIADQNMSNMVSVDGRAKRTLVTVRNLLFVLVLSGATLAGVVIWTVSIAILRPLNDLTKSARQIEAGNLDLNLSQRSPDEIGRLAEAFNSMALRLREFKQIDHDRLMRSQQTTQLAIDSLPEAVFVIGPDDTIEISNEASRLHFGIEPGKAISELGLKWLIPMYEKVKTQHRAVEPQGYKSAVQVFVNGEERFFLPKAVPMWSADQRLLGVTAILIDITQLRQVDEAKSNLVSTVSHELRTPLTSQQLLLGLLITTAGPTLTDTQKRMLEVAKADSDRLQRTIDNLLGITRIESGRAQFQFRPMQPREIVATAIAQFGELFINQKLKLTVTASSGLPLVNADPTSINSALTNLLSNALKFSPPGGQVEVSVVAQGNRLIFSVSDTGPGIPVEFQSRIFEKFFRVPISTGPSGAGLGLSIAKEIVEAHGGQIEFTSPLSGGAVFKFWLPTHDINAES